MLIKYLAVKAPTCRHSLFLLQRPVIIKKWSFMKTCQGEPLQLRFRFNTLSDISRLILLDSICVTNVPAICVYRWLDVLRHSLSVSDGSTGGGAESTGAGQDPALVHHEAADRLPRAPQQTCRHMLLLLGGSYTRGTDGCNRHNHVFAHKLLPVSACQRV